MLLYTNLNIEYLPGSKIESIESIRSEMDHLLFDY